MLVASPLRGSTMQESLLPQAGQVGLSAAPRAAHAAKPRVEAHTEQGQHQHGHQVASRARQQSTPSIQPLAGVRVVASLVGHSRNKRKKQNGLCSCAQTQVDHMGCPPCMTKGADHTHSNTPEPGMGGTAERTTLGHEWRGTNIRREMANRGLKDDVKDGKTTCGASIQNTQFPPKALVRVRVVLSLLGHSRLETPCSRAKYTGRPMKP